MSSFEVIVHLIGYKRLAGVCCLGLSWQYGWQRRWRWRWMAVSGCVNSNGSSSPPTPAPRASLMSIRFSKLPFASSPFTFFFLDGLIHLPLLTPLAPTLPSPPPSVLRLLHVFFRFSKLSFTSTPFTFFFLDALNRLPHLTFMTPSSPPPSTLRLSSTASSAFLNCDPPHPRFFFPCPLLPVFLSQLLDFIFT